MMTLLKIDMTSGKIIPEPFPKHKVVGGRGLIDYLMTEYGSPTAHPLSEESLFIVAPGLLAGTSAPMSGRLSVGGKSPLTGGIKEANSGGTAAHKLGRLGIRGIMVQGKSKDWQILKIDSQGTKIEPAGDIAGLTNYRACEILRQRYGDKIGIIIIGPAGEMKLANSTVAITDVEGRPCRHCARGGVGAIMGAKGLKAIVIDDTGGTFRKAAIPEEFNAAVKAAVEAINASPFTEPLNKFGTPVFTQMDQARGSLPSYNHRAGAFEKAEKLIINKFLELNMPRGGTMGHGCMPGCVVRCSSIWHNPSGEYLTAAFEFETICLLGSNLGIDDLDAIARMDRKCDELGLDTIEMGGAIGVLNDVGSFNFGDAPKAEAYIDEVAKGTPLGRILGSGVAVTAKVFGINRVPAVKGQGLPGHSGRSLKGFGVGYATSPQGADHTAGIIHTENELDPKGKVELSRQTQITQAALDASGICLFSNLFGPTGGPVVMPMIKALYGLIWTEADYLEMGKEILRQERTFNIKAGIAPSQDRLPDWMVKEPLPPTNAVFDVPQEELDRFFNF
jgi:aldehyde:ferredoxin oxidoreductase